MNLFSPLPAPANEEQINPLLETGNLRIEQIVSNGNASPPGFWYDQETEEWVTLLRGSAALKFENGGLIEMTAGDCLLIQPHARHRLERTSPDAVWLAVHHFPGHETAPPKAPPPGG